MKIINNDINIYINNIKMNEWMKIYKIIFYKYDEIMNRKMKIYLEINSFYI